jgi:hypothetical protein
MTFSDYQRTFDEILAGKNTNAPYDDPHFIEYTKLNFSRINRWLKKGEILSESIEALNSISKKQTWVIIAEPWCGDAAHCVPFIVKMAELNPLITFEIQLRDSENSEIENYLTNGGKAIPRLIIRDANNTDLFVWGPRPEPVHVLFLESKTEQLSVDDQKIALQNWYNKDLGQTIQQEIIAGIKIIS